MSRNANQEAREHKNYLLTLDRRHACVDKAAKRRSDAPAARRPTRSLRPSGPEAAPARPGRATLPLTLAGQPLMWGRMKYSGKARKAAFKLIVLTFLVGFVIWALMAFGSLITAILSAIAVPALLVLWVLFSIFTLYFFRDPNAHVPAGPNLVVSPAHGKVDVIDTVEEPLFMGGRCQRVSIFLS